MQIDQNGRVTWSPGIPDITGSPYHVVVTVTDNRTDMEYDEQGRLTAVVLPAVPDPILRDANNNPLMVRPRWQYQYDAQGNLTQIRDNFAEVSPTDIRTEHDGDNDDDTRITSYQYNSAGQETLRTLPAGNQEQDQYDLRDRLTLHVSFEGVVEQYVYDDTAVGDGRLTATRFYPSLAAYNNGAGTPSETESYTYDALGRLIATAHDLGGGNVQTFATQYDPEGKIAQESSPTGIVNYEYDAVGRQTRVWTAANAAPTVPVLDTRYTYDTLGRLSVVQTVTRDGLPVDVDPATPGNQPETTRYYYNLLGLPTRAELPNSLVEGYTFNNLNQLTEVAQYRSDSDNTNLSDNPKVAEFDYTVRPDGKRTGLTETFWLNGGNPANPAVPETTTYTWAYDAAGRLSSETLVSFYHALDRTTNFTMDLVGNRVKESIDLASTPGVIDQVFSYTYDVNDRLLQLTLDNNNDGTIDQTTVYDWGMTAPNPAGGAQELSATVENGAGVLVSRQLMAYDLQGQLASVVNETYNAQGQLTWRNRVSYEYNPEGIRFLAVEATDSNLDGTFSPNETTGSTEYLIDMNNITGLSQTLMETEKNAAGQPIRRESYTFGGDGITQTVTQLNPTTGAPTSTATHAFLHDGHGSVRALVDAATTIVQVYTYGAFGDLLAIHNASGAFVSASATDALTNLLFAGEMFDARVGMQFLRARWYNPGTGRFEQLDPFAGDTGAPFSLNKYAYTSGDPINHGDPTGMFDGLVGLLMSMSIGTGKNGSKLSAALSALNAVQKAAKLIEFIQLVIDIVFGLSTDGIFGAVKALIGIDPTDVKAIFKEIIDGKFNNLSSASAAFLAGHPKYFKFQFPKGGKGRIGKALRVVVHLLGKSNGVQEVIGELATGMLAKVINFKELKLKVFPPVVGPDFFLRQKKTGLYGIFEAKGGTSRLSTGARYGDQMNWRWINHWYKYLADNNRGLTPDGTALYRAYYPQSRRKSILAVVTSLNLNRRKDQMKMGIQLWAKRPPTSTWRNWPRTGPNRF
jgi:RHS repeat-associated protein